MGEREIIIGGGTVTRPAGWWSPLVHAFLRHLRGVGFDRVPEPLQLLDGREVLAHIPGDSGPDGWARVVDTGGLEEFARLLRDFHDASRGFTPPDGARWAVPGLPGADVVCHGDFGPWNVVWDGTRPVGLLDFDLARPAERLSDIAYALEYTAPFRDDEEAVRWHAFDRPPDRRHRIEVFAAAYGLTSTDGLVDAVIARQRRTIEDVKSLAAQRVEPQRQWVAGGRLALLHARVTWSERNRGLLRL